MCSTASLHILRGYLHVLVRPVGSRKTHRISRDLVPRDLVTSLVKAEHEFRVWVSILDCMSRDSLVLRSDFSNPMLSILNLPFALQDSWEMVGKKKGVSGQKESAPIDGDEGKENREKGGERDVARRRGGAPRRGRGASRGRECE